MAADISFEGGAEADDGLAGLGLLAQHLQAYSPERPFALAERNFALLAVPLERPEVYILEKRPGCDLGGHVLAKRLKSCFYALDAATRARVALLSFLEHYETQPLAVQKLGKESFFEDEVLRETFAAVGTCDFTLVTFVGSIDFALRQAPRIAELRGATSPLLVKISPLLHLPLLPAGMQVLHLGLDRKFIGGSRGFEGEVYDCAEGHAGTLRRLRELRELRGQGRPALVVLDCQVLASDYFQGNSVPFPLSFSKREFLDVWREICALREQLVGLSICQFNPTVEEPRSAAFLLELLHRLVCEG